MLVLWVVLIALISSHGHTDRHVLDRNDLRIWFESVLEKPDFMQFFFFFFFCKVVNLSDALLLNVILSPVTNETVKPPPAPVLTIS